MENTTKNRSKKIWLICGVVYAIAILFVLFIANLDAFNQWLGNLFTILRPVLIGLVLAYFCNPLFRFFERNVFYKVRPISLRRVLSLSFTYLVVLLILVFFLLLLIPQLVSSVMNFLENYDNYMTSVIHQLNETIIKFNHNFAETSPIIPTLDAKQIKESVAKFLGSIDREYIIELLKMVNIKYVGEFISNLVGILIDCIFGFFISLYLLNSKEKRYAQVMRFRKAFFNDKTNARITTFLTTANRSFGGFFRGKLLDSFIIAVLVYIAISIFGIEYPLLLATIIGITDIIPIIGPIIGVFPAGFIILLSQPEKLIPFIIIVILVQQLDGNIISPKILGENTGVSSLCVLIAITTMGTLWGFAGMVLGVPLFATVLELSDKYFEKKLRAKGRPTATEEYYTSDPMKHSDAPPAKRTQILRRFEKKVMRLKKESLAEGGIGDLTRFEKFQLETYALARKYNIFSGYSEESLAQFAAEETAIAATAEPEKQETTDTQKSDTAESNSEPTTTTQGE